MRSIVFTEPCVAKLIEEPIPEIKPGHVLVRLAVSTISSGTERANLVGELNISSGEYLDKVVFPRRSGYSSTGVVVEVGEGVTSLAPGDRVAMSWSQHSQYVCLPEKNVYKLHDGNTFAEAALWHIATFPMAAIRKCRLEIGESAIVMGMGVLGMMAVKLLRQAGAAPIIAVDPIAEKRELAIKLGADYTLDPFKEGFADTVKSLTDGGVKVAIEVTGNGPALDMVLDCMAYFGRVALLGCTRHSDFTIDYYHKVHGKGVVLIGAHTLARPSLESAPGMWTTRDDVLAVQKMVELGRFTLADMIEETHSPEEATEVYHRLAEQKAFPLVQFNWEALD